MKRKLRAKKWYKSTIYNVLWYQYVIDAGVGS